MADTNDAELEAAAIKIQAIQRGKAARKGDMEQVDNPLATGGGKQGDDDDSFDPHPHYKETHREGGYEESIGAFILRTLVLLVVQVMIVLSFGTVFTELGKGATIFKFLAKFHSLYGITVSCTGGLMFLLYMFDFRFWAHGIAQILVGAAVAAGVLLASIFAFRGKPYAPLAIMYVGSPLIYMFFYVAVFTTAHLSNYMRSLAIVLALAGLACVIVGGVWNDHHDFWWGTDSKSEFRARLRVCDLDMKPNCNSTAPFENCSKYHVWDGLLAEPEKYHINATSNVSTLMTNVYCITYGDGGEACYCPPELEVGDESACPDPWNKHCLAPFMLWAAPFMAAVIMLVFGLICGMLSRTVREVADEGDSLTHLHTGTKVFSYIMMIGLLGVYVASSIAGASMATADLVTTFSFLTIAICIVFIGVSVGWRSLGHQMEEIPIVRKVENARHSNMLKAIAVTFCAPVLLIFFILSFINQIFRKIFPCTKHVDDEEAALKLTQVGSNLWTVLMNWDWSAILSKMVWFGFIFFIFQVGVGKLVTLGLSCLNYALDGMNLGVVTAIYFIVGFLMFLAPPVPGIPVYLTGGIVVAANAEGVFGSFAAGVAYASFWALAVKAIAILGQQKGIGGLLGKKVGVRKAVGVNSLTIRAIKKILLEPGVTKGKVAVLVGGPDWPTSVLTGILGASYSQMIIGSAPFIVTIPVTVLAGALQLKVAESPAMAAAAGTMLFVASIFQVICLVSALVIIEDVSVTYEKELMAGPMDEEVLKLEEEAARAAERYAAATEWSVLPGGMRALLIFDAFLMQMSVWMMVGAGQDCWESVGLLPEEPCTSGFSSNSTNPCGPIDGAPLNGSLINLVKPLGWVAIAMHFSAVLLHSFAFGSWAKKAAKALPESGAGSGAGVDAALADMMGPGGGTEEEEAAVKIQAVMRGKQQRKQGLAGDMEMET